MPYPAAPDLPSLLEAAPLQPVVAQGALLGAGRTNDPAAVALLQRALGAVGLPLSADGRFGPGTAGAVERFQAQAGLTVDGKVGSYTLQALHDALEAGVTVTAPPPPPPPLPGVPSNGRYGSRVALTFDDGPHPEHTPKILDILRDRGAKATFFMVGRAAQAHPELVRRAVAEGHTIGNHSWDHPDLGKLSEADVRSQLTRAQAALVAAGAPARLTLVRPPYGSPFFDLAAARKGRVGGVLAEQGCRLVLWQIDTRDWAHPGDAPAIVEETRRWLRPDRGGVLLMHDVHPQSVEALPLVLDLIAASGFELSTVEALIATPSTHGPLA